MPACCSTCSCAAGIARIKEDRPQLVMLDVQMPAGDGFEVLRGIETRCLVLCGVDDKDNGSAPALAMELPNAALVEIAGNHMSAVTKPDFGTAIAAWLGHPL